MRPQYKVIRGAWSSWESLCEEAAEAATQAGPERLIGLSHSEDNNDGVITVWSWDEAALPKKKRATARFKIFRGVFTSWQALFDDAVQFAGEVGADRLIGISHSEGENEGVVTVWYWE